MNRNNYCGLCTECIKSCPKDHIGLFLRPFKPFLPQWIPVIQGVLLLAGKYFSCSRGYLAIKYYAKHLDWNIVAKNFTGR